MTLEEALQLTAEQATVDFKQAFEPSATGEWCELVKDLVAMANSGGGVLLIGLDDDGEPTTTAPTAAMALDPAKIDDKICKYTGQHSVAVTLACVEKRGAPVVAMLVGPARVPIVFTDPGTYAKASGKQDRAFSAGTVYLPAPVESGH